MRYEAVELDFVKRSLEILQQYDRLVRPNIPSDQHYEVTLLLNCLLGLVVLPFEHSKRAQNKDLPCVCDGDEKRISELDPVWGLDKLKIEKFRLRGDVIDPENATLRQIVAMFRHSMAHSRFGDGARMLRPQGISVHEKGRRMPRPVAGEESAQVTKLRSNES